MKALEDLLIKTSEDCMSMDHWLTYKDCLFLHFGLEHTNKAKFEAIEWAEGICFEQQTKGKE